MIKLAFSNSGKTLLGSLLAVSLLIFLIKFQAYRSFSDGENVAFHDIQVPFLQLIPKSTIFNPWVIFTSIFAEISVFFFTISAIVLYASSKYIENYWEWKQVVKFVFIVGSVTNLITVLVVIVTNIIREDVGSMEIPLGGGISYYFGFLVILKQLIPEHKIVLFEGLINFRIKLLPIILLGFVILWSLLLQTLYPALPSINSFFTSFIYLRFYQTVTVSSLLPNGDDSFMIGDASDTFQLVEFFPSIVKPILSPAFDAVYEASVLLGIITPFNDENIEQSNLRAQQRENHKVKSSTSVAERRRQVALQVIEDKINQEAK